MYFILVSKIPILDRNRMFQKAESKALQKAEHSDIHIFAKFKTRFIP